MLFSVFLQLPSVTPIRVKIKEHVGFPDPILDVIVNLVILEIDAKVSDTTIIFDCVSWIFFDKCKQ